MLIHCSLGLVLHEEHIELFTPDFKQLKKDIAGKQLEEGSLHFTGGDAMVALQSDFLNERTKPQKHDFNP